MKLPTPSLVFRRFNIEAYFSVPQKLVVYQDGTVFEIQEVVKPQSSETAQSCLREDDKLIRILE